VKVPLVSSVPTVVSDAHDVDLPLPWPLKVCRKKRNKVVRTNVEEGGTIYFPYLIFLRLFVPLFSVLSVRLTHSPLPVWLSWLVLSFHSLPLHPPRSIQSGSVENMQ
jgi:hypothetical protein